jgi:ribonuclease G
VIQELRINAGVGEIRIAGIRDGKIVHFSVERTLEDEQAQNSLVGNIVLGRIEKVVPAMDAAFVAIGLERSGFLSGQDARSLGGDTIGRSVHEGQAVLVQVVKDPIGEKGARLSTNLSLAGRYGVITPGKPGIHFSRRIEDAPEQARLAEITKGLLPPDMGMILRRASVGIVREELERDVAALLSDWEKILAAKNLSRPPVTLHRDLGPIERALRDLVTAETACVVIDDGQALLDARDYCRKFIRDAEAKLHHFMGPGGLLDEWEDDIERLQQPRAPLASGGWITIETTEALTAIDVNSGSFSQSGGRGETALAVNLEAASEIARQLILRGLGGLIVVDFIQMESERDRARIVVALEKALAASAAPARVSSMSELGLVTITRRRQGEPLAKRFSTPCPCCTGTGRIPSEATMALAALRRVEGEARANPGRGLVVRAAPSVVDWLETHRESILPRLSRRGVSRLSFEAEPQFSREVFDVRIV